MYTLAISAFLTPALASVIPIIEQPSRAANSSSCFPYNGAQLPKDFSKPDTDLSNWWCPQSLQYGSQGFSYPLEDSDCNAESNSFEAMDADFKAMKAQFGATMVRVYYPTCTESSVFENMLKAGVANDMAVIPQIWFGFDGDNSVWQASRDALISVMESEEYGPIAPYVFHSADFGSEPIGDGVDDGSDQFVADLAEFKKTMNGYGVPVAISEDWDRPGTMSGDDGEGLGPVGEKVKDNSDFVHAHVMPFYHGNMQESETWSYIEGQLQWLHSTVQMPTMVTETQWAWGPNSHFEDHVDVGVAQYESYWHKYDDECELMKELGIGWFLHTWRGEETFDMVREDGSYVMPNFKPRKC